MSCNFKVDFIGIGAEKAATTWIAKCLSEHPQICFCSSKETHFFSDDKKFVQGRDFYRSYFPACRDKKMVGEYSVTYLTSPAARARIKAWFPDVKLIVCLRNPVERAFSHYLHLQSKNLINKGTPLREAVRDFPAIIEGGMYGRYLEAYFDDFDPKRILVLFYDDVEKDPKSFIQGIYRFLGTDPDFVPRWIGKRYHTSSARFSPLYKKINKIYFALKKNAIGRLALKTAKFFGVDSYFINDIINQLRKPEFAFSEDDREYLKSIYAEDIERLKKLLNKDLKLWLQNDGTSKK